MQVVFNDGSTKAVHKITLKEWRQFMSEYMSTNPYSGSAWDILGCVRGPDSPSERPDMTSTEHSTAYSGRRDRKRKTVEVIREAMFFGVVGGAARYHKADHVTLPHQDKHDHFDRHVERAANILGLDIKYKDK